MAPAPFFLWFTSVFLCLFLPSTTRSLAFTSFVLFSKHPIQSALSPYRILLLQAVPPHLSSDLGRVCPMDSSWGVSPSSWSGCSQWQPGGARAGESTGPSWLHGVHLPLLLWASLLLLQAFLLPQTPTNYWVDPVEGRNMPWPCLSWLASGSFLPQYSALWMQAVSNLETETLSGSGEHFIHASHM